ncbi:aminopeptidase P family protein [Aquabacterium sp.]|uniref:aminopeptidase P family protein n=1 Tax=Aquabacterium sp. TaxID=1872578 RepID=UPI0035B3C3B2
MNQAARPKHLQHLREAMRQSGISACLVPSSDPHLSEYLPEHWQGRAWLSGFTGSAGTLLVGLDNSALFTDSRYWTQAEGELAGSGIALERLTGAAVPAYAAWLRAQGASGTLAVDGAVLGLGQTQALREALAAQGWQLRTDLDLVDTIWPERPALPAAPVYEHLPPHAATPRAAKLAELRTTLRERGATHHLISTLDDLAWLLNLRGADVEHNPVFLAHLLVDAERATLFVGENKIDTALAHALAADCVQLRPYAEAQAALRALPADGVMLIDPKRVTLGLREAVADGVRVIEALNPTVLSKSRKTPAEAGFVREAMERDGAAMAAFYAWFESALGRKQITELTVDERLTAERARQPGFVTTSFATIAGFNANGAQPHYRALPESHAVISTPTGVATNGLLLIDSGGQYLGGTTDITRVWPIGQINAAHQRDFTLVLKCLIALSRTRFPRGTLSPMLDAIARAPLWAEQLDYGHGTGHGVGYFLNVHEGPQSISKAIPVPDMAMQPGMITSIEPALYREGLWGIRLENLVLNVEVEDNREGYGPFLDFETLTLCPIDTRCIDLALLRDDERAWLNAYHAEALRRIGPHLRDGDALTRSWLQTRTQAI